MKRVFITLIVSLLASISALGQPGEYGNAAVNVVDGQGSPVAGATVRWADVRPNGHTIEGGGRFHSDHYKPRDARRSSFVGTYVCGERVSVAVSAPGYKSKLQTFHTTGCGAELDVVLERDGTPLPEPKPLSRISATISGLGPGRYDGALTITQDRMVYIPKISRQGPSIIELPPGTYTIEFSANGCSRVSLSDYRLADTPRVLSIDANCVQ